MDDKRLIYVVEKYEPSKKIVDLMTFKLRNIEVSSHDVENILTMNNFDFEVTAPYGPEKLFRKDEWVFKNRNEFNLSSIKMSLNMVFFLIVY